MKELRVNYEQLSAEKHNNTLGNTGEKITATLLSTAQEKGATSMFQDPSMEDDPYMDKPYLICGIIKHIKEQLQQSNCDNIPALRAQLQVAETEYSMLTRTQEDHKHCRRRSAYDNWLRNNPVVASSPADVCNTNAGEGGGSIAKV